MKETDLYQSIDSIKPDKELKPDILKAVGENDKVTVIKRPLFVPIMVGILVCINIGMATKLVIFNKSQINMADFEARTIVDSASGSTAPSEEVSGIADPDNRTFEECLNEFQDNIAGGNLTVVKQWFKPKSTYLEESYEPYYTSDEYWEEDNVNYDLSVGPNEYGLRRYVEKLSFNTALDPYNSSVKYPRHFMTNHEYIVVYDGGFEPENIISITESDVNDADVSEEQLTERFKTLNLSDTVNQGLERIAHEKIEKTDPDKKYESRNYGVVCGMYLFPRNGSDSEARSALCCYYDMGNYDEKSDIWVKDVYDLFYVDKDGEDITDKLISESDTENYWKSTVRRPEKVELPDIIGMDINEAEKVLEKAGLKLGVRSYVNMHYDGGFKAIPHNYCRTIAQSNFSSDCTEILQAG